MNNSKTTTSHHVAQHSGGARLRRFGVLALGFSPLLLGITRVQAQKPPEQAGLRPASQMASREANMIRRPTVRRALSPNLFRVNSRPPVPFKPFEMLDLKTGKPIAPDAIITLPNGKKGTAKQYYDELNTFEKWLTAHGYSLRTAPKNGKTTIAEIPLNRPLLQQQMQRATKPTRLLRRANVLASYSYKTTSAPQPIHLTLATAKAPKALTVNEREQMNRQMEAARFQAATRNNVVIDPAAWDRLVELGIWRFIPRPPQPPPCTPVHNAKNWDWNVGDNNFNAYVNGQLSLDGQACPFHHVGRHRENSLSRFTISAEGKGGGTIFGVGGDLLRVTGSVGGDDTQKTVSANLGVFVVGEQVYSLNKTQLAHWGIDDQVSKGVDFSTSIPIPVGPFTIDATVGAHGDAGFHYSMDVYTTSASLSGGPFVHTNVYAQAGIDIGIPGFLAVEPGVGVDLTLINWDMNLHGDAGIGWQGHLVVSADVYADSNLNMLAGNLYVYAKASVPCFDPWPDICHPEWDQTLFSWNGFQFNSVLFDEKADYPLQW